MFELVQAGPRSFYLNGPTKIGIYLTEGDRVYLIDSGGDRDAGRKVRQLLEQKGWTLAGILNTHAHADHIGGNRYLQNQTGCRVYSSGIEAAFTRYPILEPSFIYGGYPCGDLRHKFLLAQDSAVTDFSHESFPREVEIIPLPGHAFNMVGFRTPDGTVFLADCLSSRATLEKYAVTFIYDVAAYLQTLDVVAAMEAPLFVPSHAEAVADIRELAEYNKEKVLEVAETILTICEEPLCFDAILQKLFSRYGLTMYFQQYVLVGSTVKSYLSWLKESGRVDVECKDNLMLWRKR